MLQLAMLTILPQRESQMNSMREEQPTQFLNFGRRTRWSIS